MVLIEERAVWVPSGYGRLTAKALHSELRGQKFGDDGAPDTVKFAAVRGALVFGYNLAWYNIHRGQLSGTNDWLSLTFVVGVASRRKLQIELQDWGRNVAMGDSRIVPYLDRPDFRLSHNYATQDGAEISVALHISPDVSMERLAFKAF